MFDVKWTGSYPNLCRGEWIILKNGINVSNKIPEDKIYGSMNTAKTYKRFHLLSNWDVEWSYYYDGLEYNDWVEDNTWINYICDNDSEKEELYNAISANDWRHGSCGGCI